MSTERDLLFGVVAFQGGAVDADCLAETCAAWAAQPSQPLADLFVAQGLLTVEQRAEVEKVVARELASHGGDPEATLAATIDGLRLRLGARSLAAYGATPDDVSPVVASARGGSMKNNPVVLTDAELDSVMRSAGGF